MSESNRNLKPEPAREQALFEAASQLSGDERTGFLNGACHGDPVLRQRLEALLAAHEQTGAWLATEAAESGHPSEGSTPQARPTIKLELTDEPDEAVGQIIGRYKLLEKVGEGGCGVVYVAEQTEPVRRRVALKVIKLGMDTKAVVARFEAERQALAMMDHPNIAKVLDAGTTETGRPYFVMELVRGIRITDYCDQANLSAKERIELFNKVCQAIQHAHQKGIIHRDIKPSNILVTLHDSVPVPKVIDFGIAKATEGRLTDATAYTQLHQFIGTPAYMSPEQAEMSGLDIDTRSDIYSLGVLLYELLAGSTPFDPKELMASGIDAMRKTIREQEPMRPSTRLATLKADELTATAKRRACDAPKLIHLLKGDLDWIVMKCLEKDRTRRYETANGLAADLKRHLENEPVVARPASSAYRFQKIVRRNKLVFAATSAVALALFAGLGFSTWSFLRERKAHAGEIAARRIADEQRQKAEVRETEARLLLYEANMSLAQHAWVQNSIGRLRELLDDTRAFPDRGFEWFYWQQQTHQDIITFRGDSSSISSVALSPDGRRLVTGGWLTARIWEVSSGKELRRLKGHSLMVTSVAFSPDGLRIVTGSGDRSAKVWDSATGEALLTFREHTNPITSVAFSPDGRWVVSAAVDRTAKVWDAASGKELINLRDEDSFKINSVAFSPEGKRILTGGDSSASVWDIATGKPLVILKRPALCAAFAPDGQRIVTAMEFSLKVWDAVSGKELNTLNGHSDLVVSVAFSPDGLRIVSGGLDNTAKIWDTASGHELATFKGHIKSISSVAFSPDGRQIITGSYDGTAKLWEIPTGNSLARLEPHGPAFQHYMTFPAAFSLDGRRIVTASREDTARLWDAITGQEISAVVEANNAITSLALSPDGQRLVTGLRASAKVYDAASGRELSALVGHSAAILSATFSSDGQRIVTHSLDGTAKVWEAASGRELFTLKGHSSWAVRADFSPPISDVVLSPDGRRILTRCEDRAAKAWDGTSGRQLYTLDHGDRISSLAFSQDGRHIVTGSRDNTAAIWDAVRGRELHMLAGHEQWVLSVAFSPDGERVLTGSLDGTAKVWDAATGRVILTLKGHNRGVSSVAYSPDGRRILTGSADKTAKLWDALTGRELLTLSGHLNDVSFVAFSPNGQWIATGRKGQVEKMWGAARPDEVAKWQAEEMPVTQQ